MKTFADEVHRLRAAGMIGRIETAFCGHCKKHRIAHGERCTVCQHLIWELSATVGKMPPVRTTPEHYKRIVSK